MKFVEKVDDSLNWNCLPFNIKERQLIIKHSNTSDGHLDGLN